MVYRSQIKFRRRKHSSGRCPVINWFAEESLKINKVFLFRRIVGSRSFHVFIRHLYAFGEIPSPLPICSPWSCLLWSCRSSLCVLNVKPLSQTWLSDLFSFLLFVGYLFILLIVSFEMQNGKLENSLSSFFFPLCLCFGCWIHCWLQCHEDLSPGFLLSVLWLLFLH